MSRTPTCIVSVIFFCLALAEADWTSVTFGDITYHFDDADKKYVQIANHCSNQGLFVYIENEEQNSFLANNLRDNNPIVLGIKRVGGVWTWQATNEPAGYTAWKSGEPASDKDCAYIEMESHWISMDCNTKKKVCCVEGLKIKNPASDIGKVFDILSYMIVRSFRKLTKQS
ncbi:E-selectin-like [Anneissia japonica]|uniref:E-selectin-like n=1 Tax=Anneissia japonica TaxID=1529436 RepID=UPI001425A66B|nr:E-selectin-like [Anneissia japonica]